MYVNKLMENYCYLLQGIPHRHHDTHNIISYNDKNFAKPCYLYIAETFGRINLPMRAGGEIGENLKYGMAWLQWSLILLQSFCLAQPHSHINVKVISDAV